MKGQIFEQLNNMINTKQLGVMATVIEGDSEIFPLGSKFLVDNKGNFQGNERSRPIFLAVIDRVAGIITEKKPKIIEVNVDDVSLKIFMDPIYHKESLIILGGGHIALPLVSMAKLLNYHVTVIDDRPEFAALDRFPQADEVICNDFDKAIKEIAVDSNTYIVIITRGHQHDKICVEEVLKKAKPVYLGMIGSKRKVNMLFQELAELGYEKEKIDNIYAPIGLDIGAQTPEEIALSIMAEVVMVNHYGYSSRLRIKQGGVI